MALEDSSGLYVMLTHRHAPVCHATKSLKQTVLAAHTGFFEVNIRK